MILDSSSRASPCIARTERKSSQGKAEVGASVSISTTRGVMKGTYTIKSFCSPDLEFHMLLCRPFWLPREFTAIIITAVYHRLTAMFDQPCQRRHLPLNPETVTIENKPVTISGDPSKLPNDNTKTKLKNNSTTTTQEACGRASTTSQVLKGINQLL